MIVKANYREINDVGSFVFSKTEELESELKDISKLLSSITNCWSGIDANNFVSNSSTYVNNIGIKVYELKKISNLIQNIASKYEEKDFSFESEIKKEGLNYEKH